MRCANFAHGQQIFLTSEQGALEISMRVKALSAAAMHSAKELLQVPGATLFCQLSKTIERQAEPCAISSKTLQCVPNNTEQSSHGSRIQ
jgi:hypothetical protein